MAKIVTFGELMLRLAPNGYYRFFQNDQMQATFGGGEANVAVSLANYGMESKYVTKLPKHAIGQAAVNSLRYFGVDTSAIVRGGDRVGIYFLEKGASQRGSVCIYDRAHSAIQEADPDDFDWDSILDGADWFHFTGITPALGPNLVEICKRACIAAKEKGIKVSCDLNYRGKLWTREQAREAMTELCKYVDVCISNEDAYALLEAANCGIHLLATAHAASVSDYQQRNIYRPLWENRIFPLILVLKKDKSYTIERMSQCVTNGLVHY